jgi:putative membrane protein
MTSLKLSIVAALVIVFPLAMSAQNSSSTNNSDMGPSASGKSASVSPADKTFIKHAAEGGMAEVELGQMAAQKASSDEVKKFGERMVNDHSKANDQLKQVAADKGVEVPQKLSGKHEATKDRLSKRSGAAFDKAYMADMVKDHTEDVASFKRESQTAKDPDLRNFAQQTLPTLESHLKEAKSINQNTLQASTK